MEKQQEEQDVLGEEEKEQEVGGVGELEQELKRLVEVKLQAEVEKKMLEANLFLCKANITLEIK